MGSHTSGLFPPNHSSTAIWGRSCDKGTNPSVLPLWISLASAGASSNVDKRGDSRLNAERCASELNWTALALVAQEHRGNLFLKREESTLGLLQKERGQLSEYPRLIAQQFMPKPSSAQKLTNQIATPKPGWFLVLLDICWVAGMLILILDFFQVHQYLKFGDLEEYHQYALAFWTHAPLFHEYPKEYPPLSLIPFSLTLYPPLASHPYRMFAGWMLLLACFAYIWIARSASRSKAIAYALYLFTGAAVTTLLRFDLLPGLTTLGALIQAERRRYVWAYSLLAIGVLLKIYPIFLVPVLLAYQWNSSPGRSPEQAGAPQEGRRPRMPVGLACWWWAQAPGNRPLRWASLHTLWQRGVPVLQGLATFVAIVLLGFGVPATLNFAGVLSGFTYNLIRPIQVESFPATLLWGGAIFGFPVQVDKSFGSWNLLGPLDSYLRPLSLVGLVAGLLLVYWRVWRGKLSLGQAFIAAITVVLVSNKVLSPQYLLWVLPLVAYVEGLNGLWLVICGLTTLIYPVLYHTHWMNSLTFPLTVAVRNGLLLAAAILAVRGCPPASAAPPNLAEAEEPLPETAMAPNG